MAPLTAQDMIDAVLHPTVQALNNSGTTLESLLKDLNKERKAKETKIIKVRRNAQADEVVRQITESVGAKQKASKVRIIHETTEEQVIAIDVVNWSVRQTARMDAHKLRGDYAPQKLEIDLPKPLVILEDTSGGKRATD